MNKEIIIPAGEAERFLSSLKETLRDHGSLHGSLVRFEGLPIEEWAGPGYATAALFDPYVLTAKLKKSTIHLEWPEADAMPEGLAWKERRASQKEKISFRIHAGRTPSFFLPTLWGGVPFHRIEHSDAWRQLATVAELPGVVVREGTAVFTFNPLRVIHRYLNMADPTTTRDLTDLIVKSILAASGIESDLDDEDLRRDFHALGVNSLLLGQMHVAAGRAWSVKSIEGDLREAAACYVRGDRDGARRMLSVIFRRFEAQRKELAPAPVYIMVMPHGGILYENEGYAEYDSPEMAARVLNLLLDWAERYGAKFAPDIGAGTLEAFARIHPRTMQRMRQAWENGDIEFVNGTYGQPYMQMFPLWDQDRQFATGLKVFLELFGRRPSVFASQEIALHPALPSLLARHGFSHAIHRSQNMGLAPLDSSALIDWLAPDGSSIRALPAHPLRSECRGGEIWRHFPILLTSDRNRGLPFIAFTDLMDQTFIDIYAEETARAGRYAAVWGEFVTPTEFFEKTGGIAATETSYALDQYHYALDLAGNTIHGHQTGGYSSEHAFLLSEGARLRKLEAEGTPDEPALKRLMNQEAHDSYIIPYFAPGYFMEGLLTDYNGPRYRCLNDKPRGAERFIRDAAGYPARFGDSAPGDPEPCTIRGETLAASGHALGFHPRNGSLVSLDGMPVSLGLLKFDGGAFQVGSHAMEDGRWRLTGLLPGFGEVCIGYFVHGNRLYGEVSVKDPAFAWSSAEVCWGRCVVLEHAKPPLARVVRTVSGVSEPTTLEKFHSLDVLEIRNNDAALRLGHGGNIFFRQSPEAVQNRLWCYDEFCDRFWWSLSLDAQPVETRSR